MNAKAKQSNGFNHRFTYPNATWYDEYKKAIFRYETAIFPLNVKHKTVDREEVVIGETSDRFILLYLMEQRTIDLPNAIWIKKEWSPCSVQKSKLVKWL